jgi:hypothetical protein
MKARLFAVALLLPSAALATEQGEAAVRAHMECVCKSAVSMDDGRMNAGRVAQDVMPLCRAEHETAMVATSAEKWKATPPQNARELEYSHTVAAVSFCRDRMGRRGPNKP